jgi:hypothetical protein
MMSVEGIAMAKTSMEITMSEEDHDEANAHTSADLAKDIIAKLSRRK